MKCENIKIKQKYMKFFLSFKFYKIKLCKLSIVIAIMRLIIYSNTKYIQSKVIVKQKP